MGRENWKNIRLEKNTCISGCDERGVVVRIVLDQNWGETY